MEYTVVINGKNKRGMVETHSFKINAQTPSEAVAAAEVHVGIDHKHEVGQVTKILDPNGNNILPPPSARPEMFNTGDPRGYVPFG